MRRAGFVWVVLCVVVLVVVGCRGGGDDVDAEVDLVGDFAAFPPYGRDSTTRVTCAEGAGSELEVASLKSSLVAPEGWVGLTFHNGTDHAVRATIRAVHLGRSATTIVPAHAGPYHFPVRVTGDFVELECGTVSRHADDASLVRIDVNR